MLSGEIRLRHRPKYRLPVREGPLKSGERIIWLAQLSGRGDHLFPVPGVVVAVAGRNVTIAVEAFGGETVRRVVRPDCLLPRPEWYRLPRLVVARALQVVLLPCLPVAAKRRTSSAPVLRPGLSHVLPGRLVDPVSAPWWRFLAP